MDAVGVQQRPQVTARLLQRRADRAPAGPGQRCKVRYSCVGYVDRVGFDCASPHLRAVVVGFGELLRGEGGEQGGVDLRVCTA